MRAAGEVPAAGPADQIVVQGRYAYITANEAFTIVDLSNAAAPSRVGAYTLPEKIWGVRIVEPLPGYEFFVVVLVKDDVARNL